MRARFSARIALCACRDAFRARPYQKTQIRWSRASTLQRLLRRLQRSRPPSQRLQFQRALVLTRGSPKTNGFASHAPQKPRRGIGIWTLLARRASEARKVRCRLWLGTTAWALDTTASCAPLHMELANRSLCPSARIVANLVTTRQLAHPEEGANTAHRHTSAKARA